MSLGRIAAFVIGLLVAVLGLTVLWAAPTVLMPNLLVGLILIIVGVWIFLGQPLSV